MVLPGLDRGFWVFHHKKGEGVDTINSLRDVPILLV